MSFARAASLQEKKSAVFSCGLRLRKRAAKKGCLPKRSGGMFFYETFACIFTGVDGLFDELGDAGQKNCGCRGLLGSAYIPKKGGGAGRGTCFVL